ncbi:MAG: molybdopterin molybdotransferase MoeA, partial [Lautropia sp.]
MSSRPQPIPFDDALQRLLAQATAPATSETVPTLAADGRVLAADLRSTLDVPAWDNSQMDGYAVRAAELAAPLDLAGPAGLFPVSQRIAAGQQGGPLAAGTVARIFTGAALPAGADAVVMQEQASADGDRVRFSHRPEPGEWVRRTGEDIHAGAVILAAGTRLTPQAAGLAASIGAATLPVVPRLRVACFFTGDELVMPGEPLAPGAIYNSNRFVLTALLARLGCTVTDLGIVGDSLAATRAALRSAAASDLIITSGGVSVGEE